jgi:YggT family protein
MTGAVLNAVLFIISILFDFYLTVLFIRLLLAWQRADFYHPLTQFVTQLTDPVIKPLKKVVRSIGQLETATLLMMLLVAGIKNLLVILLSFGLHNPLGLLILAISDSLRIMLLTISFVLLLQALVSWVQPGSQNYYTLSRLTAFILNPIRRILPPIGGIDLSLFAAFIVLQVLIIVLVNPLESYGRALALGTISLL